MANGRPVLFLNFRFNCLTKNLTFVTIRLKSGIMVFIETAPYGAVSIVYEKWREREFRNSKWTRNKMSPVEYRGYLLAQYGRGQEVCS